jgi:hypothetical protein
MEQEGRNVSATLAGELAPTPGCNGCEWSGFDEREWIDRGCPSSENCPVHASPTRKLPPCDACCGTGFSTGVYAPHPRSTPADAFKCGACGGTGRKAAEPRPLPNCDRCEGTGIADGGETCACCREERAVDKPEGNIY